jgi:hypothetical protein
MLYTSHHTELPFSTIHRHINQSISQPIDSSTNQPTNQSKRYTMSQSSRMQSAVYTQSPLRNITAQDSVQTASSTRASRSSRTLSLRDAIHSALGSGSPVELLPNPPRRTQYISNRASTNTSPLESRRSSSTFSNEITSSPAENAAAPASLTVESDVEMPPVSWTFDDAVYATPAGKGRQ